MLTRRTFWKKTVGVAVAVVAAISGKSAVRADFMDGTTPSNTPEGETVRFRLLLPRLPNTPWHELMDIKRGDCFNQFGIRWKYEFLEMRVLIPSHPYTMKDYNRFNPDKQCSGDFLELSNISYCMSVE